MNKPVLWIIAAVLAVTVIFTFHRLLLWMERKGWIYYRKSSSHSGALGNAFMAVQSILDPEAGRAAEYQQHEEQAVTESGEPKIPGNK
jgi:hypothetical protein